LSIDENSDSRPKIRVSANPELNKFWKDYGQRILGNTIESLDERAKYMITTCAGLIVINFGILIAFSSSIQVKVTPQFFFVISTALFALSYFPLRGKFNLLSPQSIEQTYNSWVRWKIIFHQFGLGVFVAGLLALAVTNLISK